MNRLLTMLLYVEFAIEAPTGIALMFAPNWVSRLLFGTELIEAGVPAARVAGIALVNLVLCCWLANRQGGMRAALTALLAYNALIAAYLGWLGMQGETVGLLLWPATVVHFVAALLLAPGASRNAHT